MTIDICTYLAHSNSRAPQFWQYWRNHGKICRTHKSIKLKGVPRKLDFVSQGALGHDRLIQSAICHQSS
jgi:hypothetical protein